MSSHRGKRSTKGKLNQQEREELHQQIEIAKWLVNGTKHHDRENKEQTVTCSTEHVYGYLKDVVGVEPNPRCVPQGIDGVVTDAPDVVHIALFQECNEFLR